MDNNKKILFIYPPSIYPPSDYQDTKNPPMDLMYLAAIAEEAGYEAIIKDYRYGGDFISDLNKISPNYLVANITIANFKSNMELIAQAKQSCPYMTTIVKGIPFLTYNINAIYENPFLDYIIIGEAELTLKEILENTPNNEILGICYSENMQGVKNENRPLNENLDNLPFPARHLVDKKYTAVIEASRGCPFNCFYCPTTPFEGNKNRCRTIENVINEIQTCTQKFKTTHFHLKSPIFNKDWLIEFCKVLIEKKLKITWEINLIPKSIDEELVISLSKSGCRLAHLEIESGSEDILKNIGKDLSIEEIKNCSKILKKHRIKTNNIFTIGLPWETEETIEKTTNLAIELDSDYVDFKLAPPYPGTKFFTYAMLNRLCTPHLSFEKEYEEALVRSHKLSKEKITELREIALKKYYSRPKYLVKHLFKPQYIKNFFKLNKK